MLNISPSSPAQPKPSLPARKRGSHSKHGGHMKRRRGGQPGNLNACKIGTFSLRQPGPLSEIRLRLQTLRYSFIDGTLSPDEIIKQARSTLQELLPIREDFGLDLLDTVNLEIKLIKLILDADSCYTPTLLRNRALESIALDPFDLIERGCKDWCISRDADSFFPVSKLSARNSKDASLPFAKHPCGSPNVPSGCGAGGGVGDGIPPDHPSLATNLTDEQWAVLAPLIPPDPAMEWLTGQPPILIAASRWGLTRYSPTGEFNDFEIMQKYDEILQRYPAQLVPQVAASAKKRGRPRNHSISPRALLDAIIWKLATGRTWDELPFDFPPMRLCRKYYRRLFLSGRLYTLLLALYNHMRSEGVDPYSLLEQRLLTTTPSQNIALTPDAPPTWQNYTALLFMQLARDAYLHLEHETKRINPHYPLMPVLKGLASLSTGRLPDSGEPKPLVPTFQPLEKSLAHRKWKQVKRVDREVAKRLRNPDLLKHPSPQIQEEPDE